MNTFSNFCRPGKARGLAFIETVVLATCVWCAFAMPAPVHAQDDVEIIEADDIQSILNDEPEPQTDAVAKPSGIDLLSLITRGGGFMIPIGIMSLLVVALAVERTLSLRTSKVMPRDLEADLRSLANPIDRFNPSIAMKVCDENPSPAASVITTMLLRTGQPLADIERAATDAIEREADRYASPIRWLTLAAAATPLMGLLGTVWGMIVAFHESTTLTAERSRSEQLSEGIYTALVTTLAGLAVAIPAAILALYLENRLAKLFHRLEEFCFDLAPGLSRFSGRQRLDLEGKLHPMEFGTVPPPAVPVAGDSSPMPPPVAAVGTGADQRGNDQHGGAKVS
ncbi:MotA/TolQ/ExbB proton channel family protein [Rubripirellula amarantea]|nr:MotA/TolQ/ExbB proton channel family protein [Rubripirellula amarantea]